MKLNRAARAHILERLSRVRRSAIHVRTDQSKRSCRSSRKSQYRDRLDAVRVEGVAAFRMRCSQDSNPYHKDLSIELYRAWRDGWLDAWRQAR